MSCGVPQVHRGSYSERGRKCPSALLSMSSRWPRTRSRGQPRLRQEGFATVHARSASGVCEERTVRRERPGRPGTAADEEQTFEGYSAGGKAIPLRRCRKTATKGPVETQRTPCPVTGCNRPAPLLRRKPSQWATSHRGGTRILAAMPGTKPDASDGMGGSGRKRVYRRRGIREAHGSTVDSLASQPSNKPARFVARRRGQPYIIGQTTLYRIARLSTG
jgi:hypothetical protein